MIKSLKNEKSVDKILLGLAILCLLMILSLCLNVFYTGGDDYYLIVNCKKGLLQNGIDNYLNWDGRSLSIGAFVQGFCLINFPVEIITLIWSFCFLFSGFWAFKILDIEHRFIFDSKVKRYLIILLFPLILWFGSFAHLSETVYWATGGVYSFYLLIGVVWVYLFLKKEKVRYNNISKFVFLIFTFIVGSSTQNLSICLITLLFITVLSDFLKHNKDNISFNILIFLFLILGLLFISLAPGNAYRMSASNGMSFESFSFLKLAANFFTVFFKFSIWSSFLIFLSFIFAVIFFVNKNIALNFKISNFKNKQGWSCFLSATKWFWVALSSITPFIIIPELITKRTSIYFMFFIMFFIIDFTINKSTSDKIAIDFIFLKNKIKYQIFIIIVLFATMLFVTHNFYKGIKLKNAVEDRENEIRNNNKKTVYIKQIERSMNTILFKETVFKIENQDANDKYVLRSLGDYYKTKVIIVE